MLKSKLFLPISIILLAGLLQVYALLGVYAPLEVDQLRREGVKQEQAFVRSR